MGCEHQHSATTPSLSKPMSFDLIATALGRGTSENMTTASKVSTGVAAAQAAKSKMQKMVVECILVEIVSNLLSEFEILDYFCFGEVFLSTVEDFVIETSSNGGSFIPKLICASNQRNCKHQMWFFCTQPTSQRCVGNHELEE